LRALVLAAGVGSRLGNLTENIPKPMLQIDGRPILESNVRLLVRHGFNEIAINVHHLPKTITSYFGDGKAFGARIRYSHEPILLGTAGALIPLRSFLSTETFAVIYGDNISTCNLSGMLEGHRTRNATITMALWQREDVTASGIVECAQNGLITRFAEKPRASEVFSNWVSAGILLCEPRVFESIPLNQPTDFGRDVFPSLVQNHHLLFGYPMRLPERLWWVDTIDDYHRTVLNMKSRQRGES